MRPTVRNASPPASFRAFAFRTVDLVRATGLQSRCLQALIKVLLRAFSVTPCLRVEFVSAISARLPFSNYTSVDLYCAYAEDFAGTVRASASDLHGRERDARRRNRVRLVTIPRAERVGRLDRDEDPDGVRSV